MSLNLKNWFANTLALALICFGFLLITGVASADAYDHKMTVSPTDKSGDPDEQLQYTITIENTGDNDDTYDMSVTNSTIPTGYTAFILPTTLSVEEDESGTATLFVKIANRTTAEGDDTEQISFKSKSQNSDSGGKTKFQTASVTVNKVYGNTLTPSEGEKTVDPNENVKFQVSLPTPFAAGYNYISPNGRSEFLKIYEIVKNVMIERKNIHPNVDFPTGPTYHLMGFDTDFFTPIFVLSRITGWSAHILEQHAANKLIRPLASYKGSGYRKVAPLNQR